MLIIEDLKEDISVLNQVLAQTSDQDQDLHMHVHVKIFQRYCDKLMRLEDTVRALRDQMWHN